MRGRAFEDVVLDMVEGVVVTNRLVGDGAQRARTALLEAAGVVAAGVETRAA